jgi:hypothetical protein
MAVQHWIMLALTTLAGLYLARGIFRSKCASGCGSCKSGACPARKLEALRSRLEDQHSRP